MSEILKSKGIYIYNIKLLISRATNILKYNSNVHTIHEAVNIVYMDFKNKYTQIIKDSVTKKQKFIDNNLLHYWDGDIVYVTREEIMSHDMVIESGGKYKFHRPAICQLARLFERREALPLSIAMNHAWFWARRMYKEITWNGVNPNRFYAKKLSKESYAVEERKQGRPSEEFSYTEYNQQFRIWQREHRKLINNDSRHAPREISRHWCTNIGNVFNHFKYEECTILSHNNTKSGWVVKFKSNTTDNKYTMDIHKFRNLFIGKNLNIITPVNLNCLSKYGELPIYFGPDM